MRPLPHALSAEERFDRLRLLRAENVGPITFRQLLRRYGTAAAALDALPGLARGGGRKHPLAVPSRAAVEREMAAIAKLAGALVFLGEPAYPEPLAAIDDAPPVLAVRGHPGLLQRPMLAVVGARNASMNGRILAEQVAGGVGPQGFVVVSGLARGIDTAAHTAALACGTLAVMAGGLDVVYPPENEGLYARICAEGAVVAEMPPGMQPTARLFPRRNRVIAGLALGTVVVEAAERSGSLITARLALDYGREVMAVPGSPLDPRARGSNGLLRQGATLVESAADVLAALGRATPPAALERGHRGDGPAAPPQPLPESELAGARRRMHEALSPSPTSVDELLRRCDVSPALGAAVLLELELAGRLERMSGGRVCLIGAGVDAEPELPLD